MNSSQVKVLCDQAVAEYIKNTTLAKFKEDKIIAEDTSLDKIIAECQAVRRACDTSDEESSDEECEADVEEFEFEGNTYLKDDDENVYKNDLTVVEQIGVWDEENERIEFDDDHRCLISEHFTAKKCYSVRAEYNPRTVFQWCKFNGKICAGCWEPFLEGQKKLDEQSTEEQNADIKDMLRKSLKGSPLVKNLAAELRKKGVSVEDLRGGRAVKA